MPVIRFVLLALALSVLPAIADDSEISIATPTGTLWGSLNNPASGKAAALILPGSGPTDRNGNGPTIHPNSYASLAGGLAAQHVATLRIDKRGIGLSASALASEAGLTITTYADDARAWASELRRRTGQHCVWLVGHSEGALIAELAAANNLDICGLVLIASPGRRLGAIIATQLAAAPPEIKQQVDTILASLEAGKTVTDIPPSLAALFRPSVQPYLISELSLDPASLLARLNLPVLILQGDSDLQVTVEDAERLAAARPGAKLVILPHVNDVLKTVPADRAGNLATYGDPNLPLAPGIVEAIADFVLRRN